MFFIRKKKVSACVKQPCLKRKRFSHQFGLCYMQLLLYVAMVWNRCVKCTRPTIEIVMSEAKGAQCSINNAVP
jgi:hypothetical protein